ncbi:putative Prion-inhibition and propagation HeLo domain-containing protein [Seiridium cardinale]
MAEAAGLAFGVNGLAGLYSACIECFDAVQQGRHLGQDYGILEAMLNNQGLRLLAWGNACGLLDISVDELRRMTNEGVCASIENTLRHIFLLFENGKQVQGKYGLRKCPDGVKPYDLQGDATVPVILRPAKPATSTYDRMIQTAREDARAVRRGNGLTGLAKWAIEDRTKFKDLVQNIKDLIEDLETLTASFGIMHRQQQIIRGHVETIEEWAASVRLIELRSASTEINVATLGDISSRSEPVPLPRRRQNDTLLEPAVSERRASSLRSVGTFRSIRHLATSPRNFLLVRQRRDTIKQYQRPGTAALPENDDSRGRRGISLLHATDKPFVPLIFIHGLGGGSIKTWSKDGNPLAYWPKVWPPQGAGMQHANIYAYGYESGSLLGGSTDLALNIATLGESLLNDLKTTTDELDGEETPLILIGHSLGGLVMKKAYIMAHDRSTSATNSQHLDQTFYKRVIF